MIQTADPGFRTVGQATAQRLARHAAERGQLGRTLLVHGPRGAGKDAFVDDLLALAFCVEADPAGRPCNVCRGCRDARCRAHPDLVIGSPEAWRERRSTGESIVAVARRWLLEAAGAPVVAERRIVLVEHADRASEQVQNALLKALEEPTDRHTFVLVADEPSRLLATIRSRCQSLRIGPIPRDELLSLLMDRRMSLPADQAETLATLANGLPGLALRYADQPDVLSWRRRVQAELLSLLERGRAERFGAVGDLLDEASRLDAPAPVVSEEEGEPSRTPAGLQRVGAARLVEIWLGLSRDLLVAAAGRSTLAPSGELAPEIARLGSSLGAPAMVAMIALLERIHDGLRENASPRLALEVAMLAWPQSSR